MTPDTLNLRFQRGADFCMPLLLMDSGFRYIQISSINPTSPLTITAPDHGMPSPEWPAWLEGTSSSQLNRDRLRGRSPLRSASTMTAVVKERVTALGDLRAQHARLAD